MNLLDPQFPISLDESDTIAHLRDAFHIPKIKDYNPNSINSSEDCIYLCGNSLGLLPKKTNELIQQELNVWKTKGVHGHFSHDYNRPWVSVDDNVVQESARIVGALTEEVAIMNSLTANLHFLMISFYRPCSARYKILMESKAFPSDYFAIESQVKLHGYDPKDAIIQLSPSEGEYSLSTKDIMDAIDIHGSSVALILFSGVQYYTGQFFDISKITLKGHEKGCVVGIDLAHAVGNVALHLHDWNVDFAVWCTYKYLNSGPGGIGGAFVHSNHNGKEYPRLNGWWGSDPSVKFDMSLNFIPVQGANAYRVSNPNVLATTCLLGSLKVFAETDMATLVKKSVSLTGYMEKLLNTLNHFQIITPKNPLERGCQLSLLFEPGYLDKVFHHLESKGIICDERKPNVLRVAPTPLYNTYRDVYQFYLALKEILS